MPCCRLSLLSAPAAPCPCLPPACAISLLRPCPARAASFHRVWRVGSRKEADKALATAGVDDHFVRAFLLTNLMSMPKVTTADANERRSAPSPHFGVSTGTLQEQVPADDFLSIYRLRLPMAKGGLSKFGWKCNLPALLGHTAPPTPHTHHHHPDGSLPPLSHQLSSDGTTPLVNLLGPWPCCGGH